MTINANSQSQPDLITQIGVAVTLFSGIALLTSYLNHLLFYSYFGIPISNYIQVGEAVVLFIPQFILYTFYVTILLILFRTTGLLKMVFLRSNVSLNIHNLPMIKDFSRFREKVFIFKNEGFTIGKVFDIVIDLSWLLVTVMLYTLVFIMGFSFVILPYFDREIDFKLKQGPQTVVVAYLFSLYSIDIIFDYVQSLFLKEASKRIYDIFYYVKIVVIFIIYIYNINFINTTNIKLGFADYDIEFTYNGKKIKTSEDLVYIGGTQNFVFLRDRKSSENLIYKMENIDDYKIKKIDYVFVWMWENEYYK